LQIRVAMAQMNPTLGDLEGNASLIIDFAKKAIEAKSDLVAFPEMAITGYPPMDLLPPRETRPPAGTRMPEQERFVRSNKEYLAHIAKEITGIVGIIGFVDYDETRLFNSAALIGDGGILAVVHKTLLPTYDVFDEQRYFTPAESNRPVTVKVHNTDISVGICICEDIWDEKIGYGVKIIDRLCSQGAQLVVSINASPFHDKIRDTRLQILREKVRRLHVPIFYVNMIGGQDELVFDGESLVVDSTGRLVGIGKQFEEDLVITDLNLDRGSAVGGPVNEPTYYSEEAMFNALVLGVKDYFRKTGFKRALIGLSGGIDSSLTAVVATEALGKENVTGVSMPSRYSSDHSKDDAKHLAENLGIDYLSIPIEPVFMAYTQHLASYFKGREPDVAEENLQSRIRGGILMALSNKFGDLVLATGNKTELALGYATLYGDMSGGLEVIGDVSKVEVYALAKYYNQRGKKAIIPENCFSKIPSAELRPNQFDPFDYSIVSPLVDEVIENRLSKGELIQKGYPEQVVDDTMRRIRVAEYKRRQAAPAIKITRKAFGLGWKMPIVNKFIN
jgi:NAD+ synthase (glutamine-hydrolysing)